MNESFEKTHIVNQIDNLKIEIENIINKKKSTPDKLEQIDLDNDKKKKMDRLKILNDNLKEIYKQEKMLLQNKVELISANKQLDNLEFSQAKKRKNHIVMDQAKQAKQQRDETRNEYLKYLNSEKNYLEYDPKQLPGYLFFHTSILKTYGLCPYIEIQQNEQSLQSKNLSNHVYNLRIDWLHSQTDKGALYFNLYETLVNNKEINELSKQKNIIENDIYNFTKDILSESQFELYNDTVLSIKEYVNTVIKTKKIKERYKNSIHNLSILFSETSIEFHKYISLKYNYDIVINTMDSKQKTVEKIQSIIQNENYQNMLNDFQVVDEDVSNKSKFNKNILKNLNMELYSYFSDRQKFITKYNNTYVNIIKKITIVQTGKYFKKWSELENNEKLERFESYSNYYIEKLISNKTIDENTKQESFENLYNLLKTSFDNKTLSYKNYTWNIKRGVIENIKNLEYNETNEFILKPNVKNEPPPETTNTNTNDNANNDDNTNTNDNANNDDNTDTNTDILLPVKKKKISVRTIITKDIEKIINEELLHLILKRIDKKVFQENKITQEKDFFIEYIKNKLRIKKITVNDKMRIFKIYDDILQVVQNNKT